MSGRRVVGRSPRPVGQPLRAGSLLRRFLVGDGFTYAPGVALGLMCAQIPNHNRRVVNPCPRLKISAEVLLTYYYFYVIQDLVVSGP